MRRVVWVALAVPFGGCELFNGIKEDVEGVIDPTVAVGVFTRLDPPESDEVDLSELDLQPGLAGTLFLANARSVNDLANAPITGATVEVEGCGEVVTLDESASGTYTLTPGTPLDDCAGDLVLTRTDAERPTVIPLTFPASPTWSLPETWRPGDADITVPVSESDYASALAVLMDASNGDVTFSNEPEGILGYYQFLTGSGEVQDVTFTSEHLRADTVMAALMTGLVKLRNTEMEEVNTALSVVDCGRTQVYPISTLPPDPT